jgi:hypothetical protein
MNGAAFRSLALKYPGVTEGAHRGHADFRLGKRVMATLGYPRDGWAMVVLPPEQQAMLVAAEPAVFSPANGAWGRKGSTLVALENADAATVQSALAMAWHKLVDQVGK